MAGKNIDPQQLERARLRAYKRVFDNEEGHRVLRDLCRTFHVFEAVQTPGDAMGLAYREGTRAVVIEITEMVNLDPAQLMNQTQTTPD